MVDIKSMSLEEKIGQLLVIGFDGYEYNEHLQEIIEKYKVGNIILFTRNIDDLEQLYNLNKRIYTEILKHTKIIPFMTIDQEGGMVTRIISEATFFPGNMTLSATSPQYAYYVGKMMGEELLALGLNFNLAPVLDVNNNPKNPVIGVRSYSDNPEKVALYGKNYIRGLKEKGVITTGKHFPGHGDTSTDSHYSMTIVPHNKERLEQIELVPFKECIKEGIDAIMSAHVLFPAFEPNNLPATLSYNVLTKLLRQQLNFNGLIISDCMEMKAIADYYTTEKAAVMGLKAGLDLICISHTLEKQRRAVELIIEAVKNNEIPIEIIDEKVSRILQYKQRIKPLVEEKFLNKQFHDVYPVLTNKENKEFVQKIVDESLTLVQGSIFKKLEKSLLIATEPFATTIAEDVVSQRSIIDQAKNTLSGFEFIKIPVNLDDELIDHIVFKAQSFHQIVVCTYNANFYKSQVKLINHLNQLQKDIHVISTRNPYDYLSLRHIENFLCVYEYTPNSIQTIIKYLEGKLYPSGKLPVDLIFRPDIGASLYVGLSDYPLEKNIDFLEMLAKENISKVFISAHMPEMNEGFVEELKIVLNKAKELNIQVVLDISKNYFDKVKDIIHDIYSLRFDYGFSDDEIAQIAEQYNFYIELNASTVSKEQLKILQNKGLKLDRIRISYNFYPKPYTGMTYQEFIKRNKFFKSLGLTTMAYIPAKNKRLPIYAGLPTLEEHRTAELEVCLQELAWMGVDEIFFGDSYVTSEELKTAKELDYRVINIPIVVKKGLSDLELNILNQKHQIRVDQSDYLLRAVGRVKEDKIMPFNTVARKKGDITIDNCLFSRYQGELNIVKQDLPKDEKVNVVGYVLATNFLLNKLVPGSTFKFIIKGEVK